MTAKETAAAKTTEAAYIVKNMDSGCRDYPLKGGGSVYLPARHKGAKWPEIKESQISAALQKAAARGHVVLVKIENKEE